MFSTTLDTTTMAEDVMEKKMVQFLDVGGMAWEKVCGIDGAAGMLSSKSGFQTKVKSLASQAKLRNPLYDSWLCLIM